MSDKNHFENEDHLWQTHMKMLMKRKKNMEVAQIIDDALLEWYSSKGESVPNWRVPKNPEWWILYLGSLGIDINNP